MGAPLKIHSSLDKTSDLATTGLFFSVFLIVSLSMPYFYFLHPLWQSNAAQSWIATPCQIRYSEVQSHRGRKGGISYSVAISYRYQVAGRLYGSDQYDFTVGSSDSYGWRAAVVQANPPGKKTVCYVDPQDAENAVLSRSFERNVVALALPCVFGLVGLVGLKPVMLGLLRHRKFGESVFELPKAPATMGGALEGAVTVERVIRPENGFAVKLACIHRVITGSGKSRRVDDTTLWQDSRQVQSGMEGSAPVVFALPENGVETSSVSVNDRTFWRLDVTAKVPGVGYAAQFEVPVARREGSPDASAPPAGETAEDTASPPAVAQMEAAFPLPAHSHIQFKYTAEGLEFYFPAFSRPRYVLGLIVLLVVWAAVTWYVVFQLGSIGVRVPLLFSIACGGLELVLLYAWVNECFFSATVMVQPGKIVETGRIFGKNLVVVIPASDISEIKVMPARSLGGHVFYKVRVARRSNISLTLGDRLEMDSQEAHWLALEMARLTGIRAQG